MRGKLQFGFSTRMLAAATALVPYHPSINMAGRQPRQKVQTKTRPGKSKSGRGGSSAAGFGGRKIEPVWRCVEGCGACCKLDKGPAFATPEEIFEDPRDVEVRLLVTSIWLTPPCPQHIRWNASFNQEAEGDWFFRIKLLYARKLFWFTRWFHCSVSNTAYCFEYFMKRLIISCRFAFKFSALQKHGRFRWVVRSLWEKHAQVLDLSW